MKLCKDLRPREHEESANQHGPGGNVQEGRGGSYMGHITSYVKFVF